MASTTLFSNALRKVLPARSRNEAGGRAYALPPKHQLAQFAATGCFNQTYYAYGADQLDRVKALCREVEPEFIAKTAIYARERGYMKDMPALLCAILATEDGELLESIFARVIDNGKMLRNFVQILRSGETGRMSLGTRPKRLVREWLASRKDEEIFEASVGNSPSLADIVKMVHPRPATRSREALYGWMIGRDYDAASLPQIVKNFEAFKSGESAKVPAVPFQMLTALNLGREQWAEIAVNARWHMLRMNLNTFARHGVLEDPQVVKKLAGRLADPRRIKSARAFPYQLLAAWRATGTEVPKKLKDALESAMEAAIQNVPRVDGKVYVFPDVSGSMGAPVTGFRPGATSAVRCIDVAALVSASFVRKNPQTEVIPFGSNAMEWKPERGSTVMQNAEALARLWGGGTNCAAPLRKLNARKAKADLIVYVSDSESWMDIARGRGTATMEEWNRFKTRNPRARLVCLDLQPYASTQAYNREDVLNIGGFADNVFEIIGQFAARGMNAKQWVEVIEEITL